MSITDELREWAKGSMLSSWMAEHLTAIADHIDAEHEESIQREHESAYDAGYAEGMGVANKADMRAEYLRGKNDGYDEGWDAAAKTMTERMVELPKDADGVPIHVGDVMELVSYDEDYRPVIRTVDAVGEQVFFAWSKPSGRYAQYEACAYRHYHKPTVEDVLTEFGIDWEHESDCEDRAALLKEYASKLRLVEGEDA